MRLAGWGAAAVLVVGSTLAPGAATAAGGTWQKAFTSNYTPSRTGPGDRFDAVVALDRRTAFAAGEHLTDSFTASLIVYRWDGTSWAPMPVQPTQATSMDGGITADIAATSATNVWVVANDPGNRLIEHWNGAGWSTVSAAGLPPTWSGSLILGAGKVWLVGSGSFDGSAVLLTGRRSGFIARYDARHSRWQTHQATRFGALTAGTYSAAAGGWAVGTVRVGQFDFDGMPLVEHLVGGTWRPTRTPRRTMSLTGIAARSADSALAIGDGVLAWNGKRWRTVAPPPGAGEFNAVAVDPDGGYWVAGVSRSHPRRSVYYRLFHGRWSISLGPKRVLRHSPDQYVGITDLATAHGRSWGVGFDAANDCGDLDGCVDTQAGALVIDRMG